MKLSKVEYKYEEGYGVFASRINSLIAGMDGAPFNMALTKVAPGETVKKHNHEETEIFLMLDGPELSAYVGNETISFKKDDLIFAEREEYHEFTNHSNQTCTLFSIWWN